MSDAPVDPAEVPVFTGDLGALDASVKALAGHGTKVVDAAGDVHTTFGGLRAFYTAPEAEQLFATTQPVKDKALGFSSDLGVIAGALGAYADDVRPLKARLDSLRAEAGTFRANEADDPKWDYVDPYPRTPFSGEIQERQPCRSQEIVSIAVAAYYARPN